ncbi:hypothetical protein D918_00552 [Trichuris suis]|nr:hypothetical protein D918_00552 [Trichuris suis]
MPEDVYETGDLPESDQPVFLKENFESEHIDSVSLKPLAAYETFKGKSLDTAVTGTILCVQLLCVVIFVPARFFRFNCHSPSSRIRVRPHLNRTGKSSSLLYEKNVGDRSEPETLTQQYNRLNCEITELSQKLAALKQP